jgi:hypothetical protein
MQRCCAGPWKRSCPRRKSTSPTGWMREWFPSARAASISTTISNMSVSMLHALGPDTHVMAVCQPSVPVLAAVALMEARGGQDGAIINDADGRSRSTPARTRRPSTNWPAASRSNGSRDNVIMQVPWPQSGLHARRLSGLPAALGLHVDESRQAHDRPEGLLRSPGAERRRFGREAPGILRRVSRGDGPDGGVLPADRGYGFHQACAAEGPDDAPRRAGRSIGDPQLRTAHHRRGRTTTFRGLAKRKRRRRSARTFRTTCAITMCSRRSGITASSTALAIVPRSRRASSTSSVPTARTTATVRRPEKRGVPLSSPAEKPPEPLRRPAMHRKIPAGTAVSRSAVGIIEPPQFLSHLDVTNDGNGCRSNDQEVRHDHVSRSYRIGRQTLDPSGMDAGNDFSDGSRLHRVLAARPGDARLHHLGRPARHLQGGCEPRDGFVLRPSSAQA